MYAGFVSKSLCVSFISVSSISVPIPSTLFTRILEEG